MSANPLPVVDQAVESELALTEMTAGIRVLARLTRVAEQTCQRSGVSLPQYRLLVTASGGTQRASELAAAVGVSRPTLTSLVDGLEQAGLVRRVPVPTDRRGIQLELTDEGRKATLRAERALSTRLLELIKGSVEDVLPLVRGLVLDIGAALDRERRAALRS